MPELYFDIKFRSDKASKRTIADELNEMQEKANKASKGSSEASQKQTKSTKKQANAEKELIQEFRRKVTLNEVQFRQGKLSQKQALKQANAIEAQAIEQGILTNETLQGVRAQKTMFLSQQRIKTGFTGMAQTSATANRSLVDLGRIVQDLPFGFLGISNNIDPALNSFRSLKEESGGTGKAFKTLLSSLKGSGGLIFALGSLLPTAVLVAQNGLNMYAKKATTAGNAVDSLTDSTRSFINDSARLRFDDGGFLNVRETEAKIESTNRLIKVFKEELEDIERITNTLRTSPIVGRTPSLANIDNLREAKTALSEIKEEFSLTDENIQNITKSLEGFNDQLKEARALRSLDAFAVWRDEVNETIDSQTSLVDIGAKNINTLVQLRDAYSSQAQAIRESGLEDEEALKRYSFLVEVRRELNSSIEEYKGETLEADQILGDFLDTQRDENDELERRKNLLKDMPKDDRIDGMDESRGLAARALIDSMRSDIEVSQAEGLAQKKLDIEKRFQEERLGIIKQFGTEEESVKEMFRLLDEQEKIAHENAKIEVVKDAREKEAKLDQTVARQRIELQQNITSALRSLSQGFAEDNKALAIGILAVEKGLAIAEVVISGIKQAQAATAQGLAFLSNPVTAPLAGNAFAQAAAIKALTAGNAAAIAAQGIGEAINISNRGSRSDVGGSGISGGGRRESEEQPRGFFITDVNEEGAFPLRPSDAGENQIVINVENRLDKEGLAMHVKEGNERVSSRNFTVISNG